MNNPLLDHSGLPSFNRINPELVEPAVEAVLSDNLAMIDRLLAAPGPRAWDPLVDSLESMEHRLGRTWAPVSHLNAVVNSKELREAYNRCLPLLSEYSTWINQHPGLYAAYKQIAESESFAALDEAQRTTVEHALRDFRLAGVALPAEQKQRYGDLQRRLHVVLWWRDVRDDRAQHVVEAGGLEPLQRLFEHGGAHRDHGSRDRHPQHLLGRLTLVDCD